MIEASSPSPRIAPEVSMSLSLLSSSALLALTLPLAAQTPGVPPPTRSSAGSVGTIEVGERVVVGLAPGAAIEDLTAATGTTCLSSIPGANVHLLQLPEGVGALDKQSLLSALQLDPATTFAEPDGRLETPESASCDQGSPGVGGLPCTIAFYDGDPAPTKYYDQPAGPVIDLADAQSYLTGTPSVVAVIDTGIDPTHWLFSDNLFGFGHDFLLDLPYALDLADGLDNDFDGVADEAAGHGTHVAGTVVLVNPDALILPLRVLDSDGNGYAYDVAAAIHYAVANGADVINLSLGMTGSSTAVSQALDFAAAMEVDVYAAAGNTGAASVHFPATHPAAAAVAAVELDDSKAWFSSYGGDVDLSAPGVDIYSAMPGGAWAWWSGTSMATAVASGLASLMISASDDDGDDGDDDPEDDGTVETMKETAVPIDAVNPGFAGQLGSGRIDAGAAAESAAD